MPANMAAILKRLAVLVAAAALAACTGSPPPPAEPGGLAIVGAQLIDGTGEDPIPDSVLVIRDDRIVAAGPRATTGIPAGAEVVDAAGQTVIPGLVDMHAHYGADADTALEMMRTQLYYGVTTARSIGTDNPEQVALMLEANAGRPDTPRLFTAGRGFTHPGGFNAGARQPTSTDEAREMVRALAGQGVHFVKMWVNEMPAPGLKITPEMRTAIVDEALANGLVPVAHIDEEADGRQLIEAGLGDFLHSTVLTFGPGSGAPMDDPEPSAAFIRMCLDNDVSFTPTLSIVQNNWHFAENPALLDDPDLRAAMNPQALARWSDPEARGRGGRRRRLRGPQGGVPATAGLRQDDARRRCPRRPRHRQRHRQRADGLGDAPRAGALRGGGVDAHGGDRRGDRHQCECDAAGGGGGVRDVGAGEDCGPCGAGCGFRWRIFGTRWRLTG